MHLFDVPDQAWHDGSPFNVHASGLDRSNGFREADVGL